MSVFDRLVNLGKGYVSTKTGGGDEDARLLDALESELAKAKVKAGDALGNARDAVQQAMAKADAGDEIAGVEPRVAEAKPNLPDPLAKVGQSTYREKPDGPVKRTFDGPARDDLADDDAAPVKKTF